MKRRVAVAVAGVAVVASATLGMGVASSTAGPTGRLIVLAEGKNTHFTSVSPDGTDRQNVRTLTPKLTWRTGPIDVTQSGDLIAASLSGSPERHLYTLPSDGSSLKQRAGDGFFVAPAFSPAGDTIAASWAFEGNQYLVTMKTDGRNQPYASDALTQGSEPRPAAGRGIAWSPDGLWIAYVTHTASWDGVVLTDPTGDNFRFPVSVWHRQKGGTIRSVGWSADSNQLVISLFDRKGFQTDLWTVDADGSNLTQITDTSRRSESSPDYSPDGTSLTYIVTNLRGTWSDVVVMAADGSARTRLQTPRVNELQVAWGG